MTEAEWLECDDFGRMSEHFAARSTDRVFRLFACACCRTIAHLFTDPRLLGVVEVAERYADGLTTDDDLRLANTTAREIRFAVETAHSQGDGSNHYPAGAAEYAADVHDLTDMESAAGSAEAHAVWAVMADGADHTELLAKLGTLIHDLFGNPFRPVHFDPAWRTDTALTLARQMYEAREFGAAPILADALQDAGCDADALLNHLRDPHAAHVRGCWALDLVLGKG